MKKKSGQIKEEEEGGKTATRQGEIVSVKKENQLSELLHTVRKLSSIESKVLLLMGLEAFIPLRAVSNSEHEEGIRVGLTWSLRDQIRFEIKKSSINK